MITAHIKQSSGETTLEDWDDSRINTDEKQLVEEFQAYVISFTKAPNQPPTLVVVARYYWELSEEVVPFISDQTGVYPKLAAFTRDTLHEISSYYRKYLDIERQITDKATIQAASHQELANLLSSISHQNEAMEERLFTMTDALEAENYTQPAQVAIWPMLDSMRLFTSLFKESAESAAVVIYGLAERAAGNEYTPLDYIRDNGAVKRTIEQRHSAEQALTSSRSKFQAYLAEHTDTIPESTQAPAAAR